MLLLFAHHLQDAEKTSPLNRSRLFELPPGDVPIPRWAREPNQTQSPKGNRTHGGIISPYNKPTNANNDGNFNNNDNTANANNNADSASFIDAATLPLRADPSTQYDRQQHHPRNAYNTAQQQQQRHGSDNHPHRQQWQQQQDYQRTTARATMGDQSYQSHRRVVNDDDDDDDDNDYENVPRRYAEETDYDAYQRELEEALSRDFTVPPGLPGPEPYRKNNASVAMTTASQNANHSVKYSAASQNPQHSVKNSSAAASQNPQPSVKHSNAAASLNPQHSVKYSTAAASQNPQHSLKYSSAAASRDIRPITPMKDKTVYNLTGNSLDFHGGVPEDPNVAETFYAQFDDFDFAEEEKEEEEEEEEETIKRTVEPFQKEGELENQSGRHVTRGTQPTLCEVVKGGPGEGSFKPG